MNSNGCVRCIIYQCGGNSKDWKRRSKKNVGTAIVRIFENISTGEIVQATFDDDCLTLIPISREASKNKLPERYIAAISENIPGEEPKVIVSIVPKAFWDEHGHLPDDIDPNVIDILAEHSFFEIQEAVFEFHGDQNEIGDILLDIGFERHDVFEQFCKFNEEEDE